MDNKWEYKVVKNRRLSPNILEERLNEMGINGWELVSANTYDLNAVMFIFKRKLS